MLLKADHVVKEFRDRSPIRRSGDGDRVVHAVDDVSLEVRDGETLGVVGPTGCGKSTLARCLTRLCGLTSGTVTFNGRDTLHAQPPRLRPSRRDVQMIFQDPSGSLTRVAASARSLVTLPSTISPAAPNASGGSRSSMEIRRAQP